MVFFILVTIVVNVLASDLSMNMMPTFMMNFSNGCDLSSCLALDELGPLPDGFPPPPPLPPFLAELLIDNNSIRINGECNFCHIFASHIDSESELILPQPEIKANDTWFFLVLASLLVFILFLAAFILIAIKCKHWKIFPFSDSCPLFPESFLRRHKTAPPPCSPSDSCISPVVNEKTPQSVITNFPKKTSISSKYWKKSNEISFRHDPTATEINDYAECNDEESCTSSPVYAELDAGVNINVNRTSNPNLLLIPQQNQSISPYAIHTYSEVADAMRIAALNSSTALLPDASYDNAAYLPSSNIDQYYGRSLRRNRPSLSQLGSTTPLLSSQNNINSSSHLTYSTKNRTHKKLRPQYGLKSHQDPVNIDRYPNRRADMGYIDLSQQTLTTFRIPYSTNPRDVPKRPLPPVPSVHL